MSSWVSNGDITMSIVAYDEVCKVSKECGDWLNLNGLQSTTPTASVLQRSVKIKSHLGIYDEKYGSGVGENDIIIIASAKENSETLVSDEKPQPILPSAKSSYKIPAVCLLSIVNIRCINFLTFIKESSEVF